MTISIKPFHYLIETGMWSFRPSITVKMSREAVALLPNDYKHVAKQIMFEILWIGTATA